MTTLGSRPGKTVTPYSSLLAVFLEPPNRQAVSTVLAGKGKQRSPTAPAARHPIAEPAPTVEHLLPDVKLPFQPPPRHQRTG